jgi:Flp pilus assembly protein TadG
MQDVRRLGSAPRKGPPVNLVWERGRGERGSQLFEFALVLPLLCVIAVGVIEFAQGFILKQKLTNAAREGARIAVQHSTGDISQLPYPNSLDIMRNAIVNYLASSDLDVSFIGATPTKTAPGEWSYDDGAGTVLIVINRVVDLNPGASFTAGTRVTVRYPCTWSFGEVIRLLAPSASYSGSFLISSEASMRQLN